VGPFQNGHCQHREKIHFQIVALSRGHPPFWFSRLTPKNEARLLDRHIKFRWGPKCTSNKDPSINFSRKTPIECVSQPEERFECFTTTSNLQQLFEYVTSNDCWLGPFYVYNILVSDSLSLTHPASVLLWFKFLPLDDAALLGSGPDSIQHARCLAFVTVGLLLEVEFGSGSKAHWFSSEFGWGGGIWSIST
jgi:hypothetical protein